MNKVDQAISCFEDGYNCSQAIFSTYGEELGIDRKTALKIAFGMGAGMGRMGKTCGAVTGAFLVLGLKFMESKESRDKVYGLVQEFTAQFEARNKSICCCELLDGCDLRSPEGQKSFREKGFLTARCTKFVKDSAEILETLIAA